MERGSRRTFALLIGAILLITAIQTQASILLDTRGGVEVWSVPQIAPGPGFLATKIVLKTPIPGAKLVTFENLAFNGDLVQTWLSGPSGTPTAKGEPVAGPTYAAEWIPFDSHLLIEPSEVGGSAGGGYSGISEINDGSIGVIPGLPSASAGPPVSGVGAISMADPTDAFFLAPAYQLNQLDLAYLVTQTGAPSNVTMTLGVLGLGIVNSGDPGGARWGFSDDNPLAIPFDAASTIPAPGALLLGSLGMGLVGWMRRRRTL